MNRFFREKDLTPITHKELDEFVNGKSFKGRNNYKLKDLQAMFGFKHMITGSPVTISSDGMKPTRFNSLSNASTSTAIPYALPFYMLGRIPGIEFTLMEKNIQ